VECSHDSDAPTSLEKASQVDDPEDVELPSTATESDSSSHQDAGPSVSEQKETFCKTVFI